VIVLEGELQLHDKDVLYRAEQVALRADVLNLVLLHHEVLLHLLDREDLLRQPVDTESHLPEGAFAYDRDGLEIIDRDLLSPSLDEGSLGLPHPVDFCLFDEQGILYEHLLRLCQLELFELLLDAVSVLLLDGFFLQENGVLF